MQVRLAKMQKKYILSLDLVQEDHLRIHFGKRVLEYMENVWYNEGKNMVKGSFYGCVKSKCFFEHTKT